MKRPSEEASSDTHRIVIVGGGAGGLELATALGNKLGRKGLASVTLIDKTRAHVWKPTLHEIAAGSLDVDVHEVDFLAQSHWHHFVYRAGEMIGLDRERREVLVAPFFDRDGEQIIPRRAVPYDTLVMAIGSLGNDFGTPGVPKYAMTLESADDARRFNRKLINACLRAQSQAEPLEPHQLQVVIVGGGATGVELAAELHEATRELIAYGFDRIDAEKDLRIQLVESGERLLAALPPRISQAAADLLRERKVEVHLQAKVAEVMQYGVQLADGRVLPAELVVWAAGVKAPEFLKDVGGLETNRINQLVVGPTLQTTRDENVFAMGDCAQCPWLGKNRSVPPRAQAAHQQASHMARQIRARLAGEPLKPFQFKDRGSLVSLGEYSTVGSLMGGLTGRSLQVEGRFARLMYDSLYKMHELALHGFPKVALDTLARIIDRRTEPRVKLH